MSSNIDENRLGDEFSFSGLRSMMKMISFLFDKGKFLTL